MFKLSYGLKFNDLSFYFLVSLIEKVLAMKSFEFQKRF